jgi:hypothetical protein
LAHEKKAIRIAGPSRISIGAFTKCSIGVESHRQSNFASLCLRTTAVPYTRRRISNGHTTSYVYDALELYIDGDVAMCAFPLIYYYIAYSNTCGGQYAVTAPRSLSDTGSAHPFTEWLRFYTHYKEHFTGIIDADLRYNLRLHIYFNNNGSADTLLYTMLLSCVGVHVISNWIQVC